MSGAMARVDTVSLAQPSAMACSMLCAGGTGTASANTAAHMAVQSAFAIVPSWAQPLQLSPDDPIAMPAMEAAALAGPIIGIA